MSIAYLYLLFNHFEILQMYNKSNKSFPVFIFTNEMFTNGTCKFNKSITRRCLYRTNAFSLNIISH